MSSESRPAKERRSSFPTGVSVSPRWSIGFFTNGNVLSTSSGLPNDTPNLYGADVALHFGRLQEGRVREVGKLTVSYSQGTAEEHITPKDLPIPESFASLLDFDIRRSATIRLISGNWSWDMDKPVYESPTLTFISPWFRLGAGGALVSQEVKSNGTTTKSDHAFFFGTGAVGGTVAAVRVGRYQFSVDGSIAVYAGSLIAMAGEGTASLTYHWF